MNGHSKWRIAHLQCLDAVTVATLYSLLIVYRRATLLHRPRGLLLPGLAAGFAAYAAAAAAAAAVVVDGVRTKSSQTTSCQCNRLARNSREC